MTLTEINFVKELADIIAYMEKLTILPILPQISTMALELIKKFCLSHRLKLPDAQIAATAIFHKAELLTLNKKDFIYIPNLKLYGMA